MIRDAGIKDETGENDSEEAGENELRNYETGKDNEKKNR